jgi:hypothetical protein
MEGFLCRFKVKMMKMVGMRIDGKYLFLTLLLMGMEGKNGWPTDVPQWLPMDDPERSTEADLSLLEPGLRDALAGGTVEKGMPRREIARLRRRFPIPRV